MKITSLMSFIDQEIKIIPCNRGGLFTIHRKFKIDGLVLSYPLGDYDFIVGLEKAHKKVVDSDFDMKTMDTNSYYIDFVVPNSPTIYTTPISSSLYSKLMTKIVDNDVHFEALNIILKVSTDVSETDIRLIDCACISDKVHHMPYVEHILPLLIECQEYILESPELIPKMRSLIINNIIA